MPFYAVRQGVEPGIYLTWEECEKQVKGFSNAQFKKFQDKLEAIHYMLLKSPESISASLAANSPEITENSSPKKNASSNLDRPEETVKRKQDSIQKSQNEHGSAFDANKDTESKNKSIKKTITSTPDIPEKKPKVQTSTPQSNERKQVSRSKSPNNHSANKIPKQTVNAQNTQANAQKTTEKSDSANQKSYLTEYEDKKIDFNFKGQKVSVYTDGACSNNGKPNAAAGIGIFWGDNHPLNVSKRLLGVPTNNRAEITAAIVAISQALNYNASEITIYTDSQFMINCMQNWIKNWKINGWKLKDGKPVKNMDELKRLDDLMSKIKTNWEHVRGHSGIYGNEQADKLATQCIK